MKKYMWVLVFWTMIFAIIPFAHATIYSGSNVVSDSQDIMFGPMKMGYSNNDFNSKGYIYTSSLTYYTGRNVYMGDVISPSSCGAGYAGYAGLSDICDFNDVSAHTFSNTVNAVWFGDKENDCYQGILIFRQNGLYGAIDPVNVENGALHYNWWYDDSGSWDSSQLCNGGNDPSDSDSDDDGIPDDVEDANGNGIVDQGETDPGNPDTDGDGIQDGTEKGYTADDIGPDTDLAFFQADLDPFTTTDPLMQDTDQDGLKDGQEDANRNGIIDNSETDPCNPDSDADGLTDGQEDVNGNGVIDAGERNPILKDNTFDANSADLTNPYMPGIPGGKITYTGTGTWNGYGRYIQGMENEVVDGVNCLKTLVKGGWGNDPDPESDPEWYYLWLAQDTDGCIWLLKIYSAVGDNTTTLGKNLAYLWLPADPIPGQIYYQSGGTYNNYYSGFYNKVLETDAMLPQLGTGAGPFTNCLKIEVVRGPDTDIRYLAQGIGIVKEEKNDGGEINGWELLSLTINDRDNDGLSDAQEAAGCTDPDDADTDDDGIADGDEDANRNGVVDAGETDPCNADTDSDGIQDGTEIGLTVHDVSGYTDLTVFKRDMDPSTITDPLNQDTDYDGVMDGQEDKNHNGRVDADEQDPTIPDTQNHADIVLDQALESDHVYAHTLICSGTDLGQTFTAGESGYLHSVDIMLKVHGTVEAPLMLDIRDTRYDGFPIAKDTQALAYASIPPEEITETGWIKVDVSTFDIAVEKGDTLAIVLRSDANPASSESDPWYAWSTTGWDDFYASGMACERIEAQEDVWMEGNTNPDIEEDRCFRSYVERRSETIWDADSDGKWSMPDIIQGLQILSGVRQ